MTDDEARQKIKESRATQDAFMKIKDNETRELYSSELKTMHEVLKGKTIAQAKDIIDELRANLQLLQYQSEYHVLR